MIFEDCELLAQLARVNGEVPAVTLSILEGSFTREQHDAFGARLIALGEGIQRRGRYEVIDGIVIEPSRALPPGDGK